MGTFKKQALGQGQSLIDFAIEKYGCYEGLTLLLMDNPDLVSAVSEILPPGTELKYRNPAPALTETNASVVAAYVANAISVACNCPDLTIEKTFVMGEPVVDYDALTLTIPFTFTGLSTTGKFKVHVLLGGGGSIDTDYDFNLSDGSLVVPISNYGAGLSNGSYIVTFIAQEDDLTSNSQTIEINAEYGKSISLDNVTSNVESNVVGVPIDLTIYITPNPGWDGTSSINWVGDEEFQLQLDNSGTWVNIGDPFTASSNVLQDIQLPNDTYNFRVVSVAESIVSNELETFIDWLHGRAWANFCMNIGSEGGNDGLLYKVTIDGVSYTVNGNSSMTGRSDMQTAMKALLDANTQGITVDEFIENGDPNNYAFKILAPVGSNATWNGKIIRVECGNTETVYQAGNITINGVSSPALGGICLMAGSAPGEGEFQFGY